ncbi:class I SAM-dependent methyltransferase [Nitrosopumilus ureiphilus]|uniref:SAM-dependent methyltransferase n=1 Tax=Nitrosopumilus ureiphilus TaxID=1470067 RepID=A0A7D5M2U3_9ARCH|nr:class I SAM-dependent methyltransferase [Nitrosopumilus ureiphilus]QLH05766.1 SAM-dependent methyltransferase [Nitrosopumilus ureiphilus]
MKFYKKNKCRICSSQNLELILDLGEQPLANAFIKKEDLEKVENKFPLRLFLCKNCFLLQLLDIVDKEFLFKQYLYLTSASKPIVTHFKKYACDIYHEFLMKKDNPLVIEIGSNDGSLLQEFKKLGTNVLGIEPAKNIAKIANDLGIPTENAFLTYKIAKKISIDNKAIVIVANNVFGHIDDLQELMKCVKLLLKDEGIFVFEVPYLLDLIQKLEFDTVYHEHLSYFSLGSLKKLMTDNEFEIFNVKKQKVHGGTIRVFAAKKNNFKPRKYVEELIDYEEKFGINKLETYKKFSDDVSRLKKSLIKELKKLKKEKKIIFGYGAPAKGNVLLNYCNIGTKFLDHIVDTTPLKQGLYTPGMHIPVKPVKILVEKGSQQVAFLLAWNYEKEILEKENQFRKNGGRFLVPIPFPRLV